jgi:trk system potassium uptake protein TrkH
MGWSIPRNLAAKAMALLVVYVVIACVAMLALQATEFGELPHDQTRGLFLEHAFEVVSALSTVGLSTGVTTQLSDAGLWVLMVCMFAGRVGPLVLAASLIGERRRLPFTRPEADVMVG